MTRVLYITDHSTLTGFGYVADKVCTGLGQKYGKDNVFMLGWGFHATEPINRGAYLMLPCGNHPNGADVLPRTLQMVQPEVVITQNDSRMLLGWWDQMFYPQGKSQLPCTWINYPVIDGYIWQKDKSTTKWPSNWTNFMKLADKTAAMSEFGGKVLTANGVENTVIPHGVETETFRPMPPQARKEIREKAGIENKFVVLGVFKNMKRKMPDKWLQMFTLFKEDKKDVIGILHTNMSPNEGGEFDIYQHCIDYGLTLGKDIFASPIGVTRNSMPIIYGTADVLLHAGFGEGFGLPVLEAMSCGLPVVGTNSTTAPELIGDCGLLVNVLKYPNGCEVTDGSYNGVQFALPDIYDGAKQLNKLYNDKTIREDLGFKSSVKAVQKYDWSVIIPKWDEMIQKAVGVGDLPEEWQALLSVANKEEKKENETKP